jgi:outer membrane protein
MQRILIAGILYLTAASAFAQEANTTLTFNEAVQIGLKNNVTLNQQKNTLFTRQVQKTQGIANFLPSVSINGEARRTDGLQPTADYKDLKDSQIDEVNASIRANLVIFNGFNNINTLNQNVNLFKAQSSLVERSKQDVIFNVTNQYLQVLLDQELLNAERSTRTTS